MEIIGMIKRHWMAIGVAAVGVKCAYDFYRSVQDTKNRKREEERDEVKDYYNVKKLRLDKDVKYSERALDSIKAMELDLKVLRYKLSSHQNLAKLVDIEKAEKHNGVVEDLSRKYLLLLQQINTVYPRVVEENNRRKLPAIQHSSSGDDEEEDDDEEKEREKIKRRTRMKTKISPRSVFPGVKSVGDLATSGHKFENLSQRQREHVFRLNHRCRTKSQELTTWNLPTRMLCGDCKQEK